MSIKLLKNTGFSTEINKFFRENKDKIIDIIIFGSAVKGKEKPEDIDLLILFKEKKDLDLSYNLRKKLERLNLNVEIISKTYKELFDTSFKAGESILSEGYSLIQKKFLAEGLGYVSFILFRYELKGLNKSERMRFYYSLYGRGKGKGKGILKKLNTIKFSGTVLLCPVENEHKIKEYLNYWKINYIEFPILIPERIIKSELFK